MRTTRSLCGSVAALLILTVLYRSLTANFDSGFSAWTSASGRLGNQHVVVHYGPAEHISRPQPPQLTEASRPPTDAIAIATAASVETREQSQVALSQTSSRPPPPPASEDRPSGTPRWLEPDGTALAFNSYAKQSLAAISPSGTTLHFTFGSSVMMDFVKNWLFFARRAGELGVPAAGIVPELDVWTYRRIPRGGSELYEKRSEWKYFRHHNSDFLEMGLVKVAFLHELLTVGFDVLISDLDVVWLNGHWRRWMTWRGFTPLPEASLIAAADVLVTTDELSAERDVHGRMTGGFHIELNTGVVYFRCTPGSLAVIQEWRRAMLRQKGRKDLNENVNDQSLFNHVVRGVEMSSTEHGRWWLTLNASGVPVPANGFDAHAAAGTIVRRVHRSHGSYRPCLPDATGPRCEPVHFTFGTLPMRPFTGGHTWFNQNVQSMPGHEEPRNEPITVHFTFQFGDTGDYPHGKRQRAREAALWAVDPPEYFTEGVFVALKGQSVDDEYQSEVYKRFPEWSPQRHMFMDAPQRRAVRDLLGLATAVGGIMVLPKLWCHCDRYWGFLSRCRMPMIQSMPLPFGCPMDSLYDTQRWNRKGVPFREHTFLDNAHVPKQMLENRVTVTVAAKGEPVRASTPTSIELPWGSPMTAVKAAVLQLNPHVRVIEIANLHLRRLCRWLGSSRANIDFNSLTRYILTESSRYCPQEDMGGYGAPGFDWQNPFTAYNCTWGFHSPTEFPTSEDACASGDGVEIVERSNSTTCPRQMLCDYNTLPDGRITKPITWCNIEGYNGMRQEYLPVTRHMLSQMPDGRCPYPPGDRPGMLGFDSRGHYVGGHR